MRVRGRPARQWKDVASEISAHLANLKRKQDFEKQLSVKIFCENENEKARKGA